MQYAAHHIGQPHVCGNTNQVLADMTETQADIIDLSRMVDIKEATQASKLALSP